MAEKYDDAEERIKPIHTKVLKLIRSRLNLLGGTDWPD